MAQINYMNRRLERLKEKIDVWAYDLKDLEDKIKELLNELKNHNKIKIELRILPPGIHSSYLQNFFRVGILKSHEINELVTNIESSIRTLIEANVLNLNKFFRKYKNLRERAIFHYKSNEIIIKNIKRTLFTVEILLFNIILS